MAVAVLNLARLDIQIVSLCRKFGADGALNSKQNADKTISKMCCFSCGRTAEYTPPPTHTHT